MTWCTFCHCAIRPDDVHTTGESGCCTLRWPDGRLRQYYYRTRRWVVLTDEEYRATAPATDETRRP